MEAGIYGEDCINGAAHDHDAKHASKRVGCSIPRSSVGYFAGERLGVWMIGGWLAARVVQNIGPRNTGMLGCALILVGAFLLAISVPVNGLFWLPVWMRMYIVPVMIMSVVLPFLSLLVCICPFVS